jgi:hypothetical protein
MLSDIVRDVLDPTTSVEIVARLETAEPLDAAVLRHTPDLVIVSEDEFHVPETWIDLLESHPGLRLLAVTSEGHRGVLCEVLGNVPPQELVEVVTSGERGPGPPL